MTISFDTAKLAKEKGFDDDCEHFWCKRHDSDDIIIWNVYDWDVSNTSAWIPLYIKAPTQSELQKWLRDNHNIDVQPYLVEILSNGRELKQDMDQREYGYRIYVEGITQWVDFNEDFSYEQALGKALEEGLKLVKQ